MNPPAVIVLLLALLLGIQPVTTDVYLPALPSIQDSFAASMAQIQLTFSGLLLAFGVSQMVWGPLSDRIGRRPVLLWGMALYTLASVGAMLAPAMGWLIAWRVLQGAAMGAAVMCARAIVRDVYRPLEGARVMSKGLSGLGIIAVLAAPLGSLMTELVGWRAAMAVPALFGAGTLALVALRFDETLAVRNPAALNPGTLLRSWGLIARHPTFNTYSLLSTASYAALFTFLASSSFVLLRILGVSKTGYGAIMAVLSALYIVGTIICRRLLARWGVRRAVALAGGITFTAGLLHCALTFFGWGESWYGAWALVIPQGLFMLAHGVHQPCAQSGAVGPFPSMAGAASALNGFFMMAVAFPIGLWIGQAMDGTPRPMAYGIAFWCGVIALTAWTWVQKYGER
ncbi:multidrug effflux MFS transporter [Ottowia thiooxydans]|uniref:multidrug effflux MFS transporter n=1 Tax=Ottowia thiooxydans TaxID=219182 RepID=UPI0004292ECF|nr:multidrug effflux MFS transporter [Ottowia thiooxydans]